MTDMEYALKERTGEAGGNPEQKTGKPSFRFYSRQDQDDITVDILLKETGDWLSGFRIVDARDGRFWVYMPGGSAKAWTRTDITWEAVRQEISDAFRQQGGRVGTSVEMPSLRVEFRRIIQVTSWLVDADLPHKLNTVKGFRLKASDTIRISPPNWMGKWQDTVYSWPVLCRLITEAYHAQIAPAPEPEKTGTGEGGKTSPKERDKFGRVKNAENTSLKFVPHTVLRLEERNEDGQQKKKNLIHLVEALSRGSAGGIGSFEVNILDWVDRLKYVTSTMLVDLVRGGLVSVGWRGEVKQDKLNKSIKNMSDYGLVNLTKFIAVDDYGVPVEESSRGIRILTLGREGSTLLHELGKNTTRYNAFNIYQDGNTVKRHLCANQWLVYWLTTFPEAVGENYETSAVVYQKGSDFSGARIYASVTCNGCPMVAEPLRRVEIFEEESNRAWLRHKFQRYLSMFSHLDELYAGQEEISFAARPVLVYLCEDDEHMQEIWDVVSDLLLAHPEQEVWFTADLRIFNYDEKGQRFLRFDETGRHIVDLQQRLGVTE